MLDVSNAILINSLKGDVQKGKVSPEVPAQLYEINLKEPSNLVVHLDRLTSDADLSLLNEQGQPVSISAVSQMVSMNIGTAAEHLDFAEASFPDKVEDPRLQAGVYYLSVNLKQGSKETSYVLEVQVAESDSMDIGTVGNLSVYRGALTSTQPKRFYKFKVDKSADYSIFLASNNESNVKLSLKNVETNKPVGEAKVQEGALSPTYSIEQNLEAATSYELTVDGSTTKDLPYIVAIRSSEFNPMMP